VSLVLERRSTMLLPKNAESAMADIRFWKWQHTDQIGMPCVTRYRLRSGAESERPKDPERGAWPLESRDPKQMSTSDDLRGAAK
jgi:hypothetical protein